jgi:membrane protein DedA with SNARE-associated domain
MPDSTAVASDPEADDVVDPADRATHEHPPPLDAPVRHRPGRRTLTLLVAPIIALVVASNVGDALATTLATTHPLTLVALNARNRNLVLVTNDLDALSYYGVATVRLLLSDPLFFLLGYWYGEAAVSWLEKRTRSFGASMRRLEGWFGRAAYPLVFVAPNNLVCLMAGAAGMSVAGFFAVNLAGTLVRLYLIRRLGEAFEAPIDDVLGFLAEYRVPLLILSVVTVAATSLMEVRRGGGELEAALHLDEDLAPAADPPEAPEQPR